MALSDCPKCWDTPCTCGYEFRHYKDMGTYIANILSYHSFEEQIESLKKAKEIINNKNKK